MLPNRTKKNAKRFIKESDLQWHQRFEIAPDVFTPGRNDIKKLCDYAGIPKDLSGRTVLDIGAWHGGFSFEMEKRGASKVVATDVLPSEHVGFSQTKEFLNSSVEYHQASVYDLDFDEIGDFDIVLFLGVLYHLRHPLLAFDNIYKLTKGVCYLESHIIDGNFLYDGIHYALEHFDKRLENISMTQFFRTDELNEDASNWFVPNVKCIESWSISAGFDPKLISVWPDPHPSRCAFELIKKTELPEYLQIRSYDRYLEGHDDN